MKKLKGKLFFQGQNYSLLNGDSLKIMKELKTLIKDKEIPPFQLIFADPPYNLSNGGFTCKSGKKASVNKGKWDKSNGLENDFAFHYNWLALAKSLLAKDGSLWVSGTYHCIYSIGFAAQKLGYKVLNDIAWFKPNAAPNLSCRYFTASHETLLWLAKDKETKHTFNYKTSKNFNNGKQMRSVWTIPTPSKKEKQFGKHPTQKPIKLLEIIIKTSAKKGDKVLDPFCGSGTTGVVAIKNGLSFIGIDTETEYLELSKKRIEFEQKNLPLININ